MKKKVPDEELFILARLGDIRGEVELTSRYLEKRITLGRRAAPAYFDFIDSYEYNCIYYRAFLQSLSSYRIGGGPFLTYMEKVLFHEIARYLSRENSENGRFVHTSFDAPINSRSHTEPIFLHDVIQDDDPNNSPVAALEYAETLDNINRLPDYLTKNDLEFMRLIIEGYSLKEACEMKGVTAYKGRRSLALFQRFITEISDHRPPVKKMKRD